MSYLIKERMMRDKANQDDSVTLGDSAVPAVNENVSAKKEGGTETPLVGAKMEKVEVASDPNLPTAVTNETSLNINDLPNEMLEKIFEKLIELKNNDNSDRKPKLIRTNQSYLNCRLVNSRWKLGMESALEKKSISFWKTKLVPNSITNMKEKPPALWYLFEHETEDGFTPITSAFLPPPLESWDGNGSPFPAHSLKLTTDWDNCDHLLRSPKPTRRAQLIRLTDLFSKFGEHLTSLILKAVTLSPETFIGILKNTPKLKALNINKVLFRGKFASFAQLPALQHLQHLRVLDLKIMLKKAEINTLDFYYGGKERKQLYNWILSPFMQQLLTLGIDGRGGNGTVANFPNLERLVMSCLHIKFVDDPSFLQPNLFLYPRLNSLFLTDVEIRFDRDIMEWFQQHIAPLAETLVELHLDTPRHRRGGWNRKGPLFQLPLKSTQNKTNEAVFRKLKKLDITFPKEPEEAEVIRALIKMFPNLEALTFLDRRYGVDAVTVVNREEYKKVCPTLKNIRIQDLD